MKLSRRDFLLSAVKGAAVSVLPMSAFRILSPSEAHAAVKETNVRWGFLVDTHKCVCCGFCDKACKTENEIPYEVPLTRTWVERYVILKDGRTLIDSPNGARDGFTEQRIQERDVDPRDIGKAFFVP